MWNAGTRVAEFNLPSELVAQIATYLDHSSLLNFSSVSRQCRDASVLRRIQHVFIPDVAEGLAASIEALSRAGGFQQHIRSVQIVRSEWLTRPHPEDVQCGVERVVDYSADYEYGAKRPWKHASHVNTTSRLSDQDIAALLDFLRKLARLTDLYWSSSQRIPLRIVKHVEEVDCRLHMQHFHLDSITAAKGGVITLSADERQLITSPALTSLSRLDYHSEGIDSHHGALMNILLTAPGLSELYLAAEKPVASSNLLGRPRPIVRLWHWPQNHVTPTVGKGRLCRFELRAWYSVDKLQWLNNHTDCRLLRCLKIHGPLTIEGITWLANNAELFNGLRDLKLGLCAAPGLISFVTSLHLLQSLQLDALSCSSLEPIVKACGRRLQCLHCHETFAGPSLLRKLSDWCPELEVLGIGVYRLQGSASELIIYRQLAQFRHLRKLHIAIRSSQYCGNAPELSELKTGDHDMDISYFDSAELDGAYFACRDLACDQMLAANVFELISRQKAACTPRLEQLILEPNAIMGETGRSRSLYLLQVFLESVALAWRCTTTYRDDSLHACIVVPFGERPFPSKDPGDHMIRVAMSHFAPVVDRLWPDNQQMKPFADRWHSFPMQDAD